jgi:hypothetical protein
LFVLFYSHDRIRRWLCRIVGCSFGGPSEKRDIEDHRFVRLFLYETRVLIRGRKYEIPVVVAVRRKPGGSLTEMKFRMVKSSVREDTFWSWPLSCARRDIISSSAESRMASVLTVYENGVEN